MITVEQIRAARAMLHLKQHELAQKAGISTGTLNNIERGVQTDPKISTLRAIRQALEAAGIEFTEGEMGGVGVQLKAQAKPNGPITLLIIDDNEADRKLYKAWLGKQTDMHYTIIETGNAKEGYDVFIRRSPACIILDFMMYGKDGFQLLVEMKNDHHKLPPIIFVTGIHSDMIKNDALAMGVHSFFDKRTLTQEKLCNAVLDAVT